MAEPVHPREGTSPKAGVNAEEHDKLRDGTVCARSPNELVDLGDRETVIFFLGARTFLITGALSITPQSAAHRKMVPRVIRR